MTLGAKIRYFRNLKGWSQNDMADKLEISLPAYSKIERDITDISFSRLTQICNVLGISLVELLSYPSKALDQNNFTKILAEKDKELIKLQKKIIELLEKQKK